MSQIASAQPLSSASVCSGRAEVVKSRSLCRRPSIASRTGPPTRASSWPASRKRRPRSSMTGVIRSSSSATERWTSVSRSGGSGASDTGVHSRRSPRATSRSTTPVEATPAARVIAVLRPLSLLPALVAVTATLAAPGSAHARPPAGDESPLAVTIDALAPAYIPNRGPIRITGSVTNNDDAPWTTVNVYAFIGRGPDDDLRRAGGGRHLRARQGRRGPDHRAQRLRHHRADRPRAERAVLRPGAALGDQRQRARRLLVRRARARGRPGGAPRRRRRPGPHLPAPRAPDEP